MSTVIPGSSTKSQEVRGSQHVLAPDRDRGQIARLVLDLLIAVVQRKRIVLIITAIFGLAALIISLILPKQYTASLTLLPPQQNSTSLSSVLASQLGGMASLAGSSLGIKNMNETYVAMLNSRIVEDAVIQRFGLMQEYRTHYISDARKAFEKHAKVTSNSKSELIDISVTDKDPNRAAEMANGYVEEFQKLTAHLAVTDAGQRRLFFEKQLVQAKDNLATAEEALKSTEQSTGLIQVDSQARALIESAATLRAQITAKEVQIEGMRTYATGENAEFVQAQQQLASLRSQLAKLGGNDSEGEGLIVPKGRVPQAALEYVRKLRDVKYYETVFDILARQFEAAKLDEAKEGAVIQVVSPAVPPDKRSFPKRTLIVIISTTAGLFLGIFVALFLSEFERFRDEPETSARFRMLLDALSLKRS
jgi:uncharacterized protein involved in exopolysaccharide biosynthesis